MPGPRAAGRGWRGAPADHGERRRRHREHEQQAGPPAEAGRAPRGRRAAARTVPSRAATALASVIAAGPPCRGARRRAPCDGAGDDERATERAEEGAGQGQRRGRSIEVRTTMPRQSSTRPAQITRSAPEPASPRMRRTSALSSAPTARAVPCRPDEGAADALLVAQQRSRSGRSRRGSSRRCRAGGRSARSGRSRRARRPRVGSAATTWSMHAVSASTSAGSTAGNIAMRSWLRPSLR